MPAIRCLFATVPETRYLALRRSQEKDRLIGEHRHRLVFETVNNRDIDTTGGAVHWRYSGQMLLIART